MAAIEPEQLLDEALSSVKQQSYYLKRAIDSDHLKDALKCSANIISELRTSSLSPKGYYQLYMSIFQELQYLYAFLCDASRRKRSLNELYESVQQAGSILPRLYLLITVGACYIQSMESPASDILRDLAELCKGVQHPIRGLFLRYYLTQMCKDKLPDSGTSFEAAGGGNIHDAFDLLFTNFTECTNLWIRLQSQSPIREKQKREGERYDLRVLIGANLVCMAQLDGMTVEFYSEIVFSKLIEFILDCKDTLGQQYLFDCLIQVFSDECHIKTLEELLHSFLLALPSVDLKPIQTNLMQRLQNFVTSDPSAVPENVAIFHLFRLHINSVMQKLLPMSDPSSLAPKTFVSNSSAQYILELQVSFLSFTLALHPDRVDYVDTILSATVEFLSNISKEEELNAVCARSVEKLLSTPLRHLSLSILEMDHFFTLMSFLSLQKQKSVALSMLDAILEASTPLNDLTSLKKFLQFISPLIGSDEKDIENGDIAVEQTKVGKLVYVISHDEVDKSFEMLLTVYEAFSSGGLHRLKYTLPAVICVSLRLLCVMWDQEDAAIQANEPLPYTLTVKKVLQLTYRMCTKFISCDAEMALRLFLMGATSASQAERREAGMYQAICYEFISQAMLCYEDEVSDSRSQYRAICILVGTMCSGITNLDAESYMNVATKITLHSSKLLRKTDQCRGVLLCSHLYWNNPNVRDSRRVLECLQKCVTITTSSMQALESASIFVEILDKYIYYFDENNPEVTAEYIRTLISLCSYQIKSGESESDENVENHFKNSLDYVKYQIERKYNSKYSALTIQEIDECCT